MALRGGQAARVQLDDAVAAFCQIHFVGNDDRCVGTLRVHGVEQFEDFGAGLFVQVAGGFVEQKDVRFVDQRAGDGHALFFAAGQRGRIGCQAVGEPDLFEQVMGALFAAHFEPGWTLKRLRIKEARYHPGLACILTYRLRCQHIGGEEVRMHLHALAFVPETRHD